MPRTALQRVVWCSFADHFNSVSLFLRFYSSIHQFHTDTEAAGSRFCWAIPPLLLGLMPSRSSHIPRAVCYSLKSTIESPVEDNDRVWLYFFFSIFDRWESLAWCEIKKKNDQFELATMKLWEIESGKYHINICVKIPRWTFFKSSYDGTVQKHTTVSIVRAKTVSACGTAAAKSMTKKPVNIRLVLIESAMLRRVREYL